MLRSLIFHVSASCAVVVAVGACLPSGDWLPGSSDDDDECESDDDCADDELCDDGECAADGGADANTAGDGDDGDGDGGEFTLCFVANADAIQEAFDCDASAIGACRDGNDTSGCYRNGGRDGEC